jgi:hypothetical protein
VRITGGIAPEDPAASVTSAALGIDEAGMLVYVRPTTTTPQGGGAGHAAVLRQLLTQMGCKNILFFRQPLGAVLGENSTPSSDAPAAKQGTGVVLVRRAGPGAKQIFPETPIVKPQVWAPMQQKRVRYR